MLCKLKRALFGTKAKRTFMDINWRVNSTYRYVSDEEQFGVKDKMVDIRTTGEGDCEDFALTKVRLLRELGFKATLARSNTHAICVAQDPETGESWALDLRSGLYDPFTGRWPNGERMVFKCRWDEEFIDGENPWKGFLY